MDINEFVEKGIQLVKEGRYEEGLRFFDQDLCFTQNPSAMSYYAVCLAMVEQNYDRAISLGLMAAEKEFYNPDVYFNLGRIFLLNGRKSVAIRAFRKGLRYDDDNKAILAEINRLGVRRKPLMSFLPRDNAVNRLLGRLARRLAVYAM